MIIITKTSSEIKSFQDELLTCNTDEQAQKMVQRMYTENILSLEKHLKDGGNAQASSTATFILSTNKKKFIINRSTSICLRIYQLHTGRSAKYESILVEPFYPGFQTILTDIYGILREDPRSTTTQSYRYSAMHTYRMRHELRKRFQQELPQFFSDNVLMIETFEDFHEMIHQLDPDKLQALFRVNTCFASMT